MAPIFGLNIIEGVKVEVVEDTNVSGCQVDSCESKKDTVSFAETVSHQYIRSILVAQHLPMPPALVDRRNAGIEESL